MVASIRRRTHAGVVRAACVLTLAGLAPIVRADAMHDNAIRVTRLVVLATQPGGTLSFEVGNALNVARIDREGVSSVDVKLRRSGDRLRGRVGRQPVSMVMEGSSVTGTVGDRPVQLLAQRVGDSLSVTGAFGARAISLRLGLRSLAGQVGPCQYQLTFDRTAYRGWVACGGRPEGVRLSIPATLAARTDAEIAAIMTPLLVL
jgi:hypothetical protein